MRRVAEFPCDGGWNPSECTRAVDWQQWWPTVQHPTVCENKWGIEAISKFVAAQSTGEPGVRNHP